MNKENKMVELTDEQLKQVNGGGVIRGVEMYSAVGGCGSTHKIYAKSNKCEFDHTCGFSVECIYR